MLSFSQYGRLFCIFCLYYGSYFNTVGFFQSPRARIHSLRLFQSRSPVIVGHSTTMKDHAYCVLDGQSGDVLFCQEIPQRHDIRDDACLRLGLGNVGHSLRDVKAFATTTDVFNTPFSEAKHDYNSFPQSYRLSQHLASAWSGMSTSSMENGLVVVMNEQGESYGNMMEDIENDKDNDSKFLHDLKLLRHYGTESYRNSPKRMIPGRSCGEAESVYRFNSKSPTMKPIFKRWSKQSLSACENYDSISSLYSRLSKLISSDAAFPEEQLFCLASLKDYLHSSSSEDFSRRLQSLSSISEEEKRTLAKEFCASSDDLSQREGISERFLRGNLLTNDFKINSEFIQSLISSDTGRKFSWKERIQLADSVTTNFQEVILNLLSGIKGETNENNVILFGSIFRNPLIREKILQSNLFKQILIPNRSSVVNNAMGCAFYAYQVTRTELFIHSGA
jgi:predicted NodU family carbamoyl transferase